jgi:hypothetical protein
MASTAVPATQAPPRWATNATFARFAAWCGVLLVLFTFAADAIFLSAGIPDNSFTTKQIADYFINHSHGLLWAHVFFNLGSIAFLFFLGVLWVMLREAEGDPPWLSAVAMWGAIAAIAGANVSNVFGGVGANIGHDYPELMNSQLGVTMFQSSVAFNLSFVGFVALQLAISFLIFRTRIFPQWIAWLGIIDMPLWLLQMWPVPRHDNQLEEILFDRTGPGAHAVQMVWLIAIIVYVIRWVHRRWPMGADERVPVRSRVGEEVSAGAE